jgi:hypothetical protein
LPQPQQVILLKNTNFNEIAGLGVESSVLDEKNARKINALKNQTRDLESELEKVQKQCQIWEKKATLALKEKERLNAKLSEKEAGRISRKGDLKASISLKEIETIQELKDQIFNLQETNQQLKNNTQVVMKGEINKLKKANQTFQDEIRNQKVFPFFFFVWF